MFAKRERKNIHFHVLLSWSCVLPCLEHTSWLICHWLYDCHWVASCPCVCLLQNIECRGKCDYFYYRKAKDYLVWTRLPPPLPPPMALAVSLCFTSLTTLLPHMSRRPRRAKWGSTRRLLSAWWKNRGKLKSCKTEKITFTLFDVQSRASNAVKTIFTEFDVRLCMMATWKSHLHKKDCTICKCTGRLQYANTFARLPRTLSAVSTVKDHLHAS